MSTQTTEADLNNSKEQIIKGIQDSIAQITKSSDEAIKPIAKEVQELKEALQKKDKSIEEQQNMLGVLEKKLTEYTTIIRTDSKSVEAEIEEKSLDSMDHFEEGLAVIFKKGGAADISSITNPDSSYNKEAASLMEKDAKRIYKELNPKINLRNLQRVKRSNTEEKMLNTIIGPEGGALVPHPLFSDIIRRQYAASVMRQVASFKIVLAYEARLLTIDSIPETRVIREGESVNEINKMAPFGERLIKMVTYFLPLRMTWHLQRLMETGQLVVDLQEIITNLILISMTLKQEKHFLYGCGVDEPQGIVGPNLESYEFDPAEGPYHYQAGKYRFVKSGDPAKISGDVILQMLGAIPELYRGRAKFMMNNATWIHIMSLKDLNGNYMFQTIQFLANREDRSIRGIPVIINDHMQGIGANSIPVIYGDFESAYIVMENLGTRIRQYAQSINDAMRIDFGAIQLVTGTVKDFQAYVALKMTA